MALGLGDARVYRGHDAGTVAFVGVNDALASRNRPGPALSRSAIVGRSLITVPARSTSEERSRKYYTGDGKARSLLEKRSTGE